MVFSYEKKTLAIGIFILEITTKNDECLRRFSVTEYGRKPAWNRKNRKSLQKIFIVVVVGDWKTPKLQSF